MHLVAPDALNVPAGQMALGGDGSVDPAPHAYPALQLLHANDPAELNVPAGHCCTVAFVAISNGHTNPAEQLLHVAAPPMLNRPGTHLDTVLVVAPGTGHSYPALQLLHDVAPATLNVPAGHIAAAGVAIADPAGHA